MHFYRSIDLADALSRKASEPLTVLAGGTDVYPSLRDRPLYFSVLDISAIETLRKIELRDGHWTIGANVTWTDVRQANLPPAFDALKLAAREVGSLQIQNRGTIVGNVCNASPAADGVPPLLVLDAQVAIASKYSERTVPLATFITGNRKTVLQDDEIVTHILVPEVSTQGSAAFVKLGARKHLVISIVMVATRIVTDGRDIVEAAVAVGACSEVAQRLGQVEQMIRGLSMSQIKALKIQPEAMSELNPIDDVRAHASYRMDAAAILVRDAVVAAMS